MVKRASVAQLAEQVTFNHGVVGSSPTGGTMYVLVIAEILTAVAWRDRKDLGYKYYYTTIRCLNDVSDVAWWT